MSAAGQDQALHRQLFVIVKFQCEVEASLQFDRGSRAAIDKIRQSTTKYGKHPHHAVGDDLAAMSPDAASPG
jgi:hypothetical protein